MSITSKYIVLRSEGENFLNFDLDLEDISLRGQNILFSGSTSVDGIALMNGVVADVSNSKGSADVVKLSGSFVDYLPFVSINTSGLLEITSATPNTPPIVLSVSRTASDIVVFDDFTMSTKAIADALFLSSRAETITVSGSAQSYYANAIVSENTLDLYQINNNELSWLKINTDAPKTLAFSDGEISVADFVAAVQANTEALELTNIDSPEPINSNILSATPSDNTNLSTNTDTEVKGIAFDAAGETFVGFGQNTFLSVSGGNGVDQVYVIKGSQVDATNLKGSSDQIYFTGRWDDYSKSIDTSGNLVFSRNVEVAGDMTLEQIKVSNGSVVATRDLLVFLDGAIKTNEAFSALKVDLTTAASALTSLDTDQTTPLIDGIAPEIVISSDKTQLAIGDTALITLTVSEPLASPLSLDDITFVGGALSNLINVSEDSLSYTATFSPQADFTGNVSLQIAGDAFQDIAGNFGQTVTFAQMSIDTQAPELQQTAFLASENQLAIGTLIVSENASIALADGADNDVFTFSDNVLQFASALDFETAKTNYELNFTLTDTVGNTSVQSVQITLTNQNEAPSAASLPEQQVDFGATITLSLSEIFSDPDSGDTLSFSINSDSDDNTASTASIVDDELQVLINTATPAPITITATDSAGLSVSQTLSFNVNQPTITTALSNMGDKVLDVHSAMVFSLSEAVTAVTGKFITLTDKTLVGYQGETELNHFVIDVTSDIVTLDNDNGLLIVQVDEHFDLDLASQYSIAIDAGAFISNASGLASQGLDDIEFMTVNPSTAADISAISPAWQMNEQTGQLETAQIWVDIEGRGNGTLATSLAGLDTDISAGNVIELDAALGNFVFTLADTDPAGGDPLVDGGIGTNTDFAVSIVNFSANDQIYVDQSVHDDNALNVVAYDFFALGNGTPDAPLMASFLNYTGDPRLYVTLDEDTLVQENSEELVPLYNSSLGAFNYALGLSPSESAIVSDSIQFNLAPKVLPFANQTVTLGDTLSLDLRPCFVDLDDEYALVFAAESPLPEGLSLNEGILSGTVTSSGSFALQITATDGSGQSSRLDFGMTVQAPPQLSTVLDDSDNQDKVLDVRSDIVLQIDQPVIGVDGKYIRLSDATVAGYQGETKRNDFVIEVTSDLVNIDNVNGTIVVDIDTLFDLDLASNYILRIDADAFVSTETGLATGEFADVSFNTVTPTFGEDTLANLGQVDMDASVANYLEDYLATPVGQTFIDYEQEIQLALAETAFSKLSDAEQAPYLVTATAAQSWTMNVTTGELEQSAQWIDIEGLGSGTNASQIEALQTDIANGNVVAIDASLAQYVFVFSDQNPLGGAQETGAGITTATDFAVLLDEFGADDVVYIDDSFNDSNALNDVALEFFAQGNGTEGAELFVGMTSIVAGDPRLYIELEGDLVADDDTETFADPSLENVNATLGLELDAPCVISA